MNFEYTFWNFLITLVMTSFFGWFFNRLKKRPIIMVLKPDLGQWIDVKKNPIPQGHRFEYFIVTDGNIVETSYTRKYNSRGELVMGYIDGEKLVKYWRPLPIPPTNSVNIGS